MSSWWDRKLNNAPQEERRSLPTERVVLPALQQQAQERVMKSPLQHQTNVAQQTDPNGQTNMGSAIRSWKGGEAHRVDGNQTCPRCGGNKVFSRSNASAGGKVPAPRCFECGWNSLYDQGEQSNWV